MTVSLLSEVSKAVVSRMTGEDGLVAVGDEGDAEAEVDPDEVTTPHEATQTSERTVGEKERVTSCK